MFSDNALVTFCFGDTTPLDEVRGTLDLALLAAESLHGPDRVRLEARTQIDPARLTCAIDASTEVGRTLSALFLGYARREFGEQLLRVSRGKGAA
jgi:hypothetical protein